MRSLTPATAEKILEVASWMFAGTQYADVHMDHVAETAGISKPTLFRYFPTKEILYEAILDNAGKELLRRLHKAEESHYNWRTQLCLVVSEAMRYFEENRHLLQLLDRAAIGPDLIRRFTSLLAIGVATGEFRVDDLYLAARSLVGAVRFQVLFPHFYGDPEKVPAWLVQMVIRPTQGEY